MLRMSSATMTSQASLQIDNPTSNFPLTIANCKPLPALLKNQENSSQHLRNQPGLAFWKIQVLRSCLEESRTKKEDIEHRHLLLHLASMDSPDS
ncbi:hypothetical protein VNO77_44866 [Canavalia gladiata]|uniref:Uncharacterized protein n=1 Tax=Canavalia gladiata TaxID=3824 RepID=A0AAN9PP56_CANGL